MGTEVMTKKRMGGMSLSSFGGVKPPQIEEPDREEIPADQPTEEAAPKSEPKPKAKRKRKETLTTVNIKIGRKQQRWLQDVAQQVRDNNDAPVPPNERVYPQHLIGAAIDLLSAQDIDWDSIKNIDDLKEALNL